MKNALITGITEQDGSYLAELLLGKGYAVHGIIRRSASFNTDRIDHLYRDPHDTQARLFLHYGDLSDGTCLRRVLQKVTPDEVYNLGAQSHVKVSFEQPGYTADIDALGTLRLLEAVHDYAGTTGKQVRFYQAGSSEMFGASPPPQNEETRFYPRSPYAVSKLAAHWYGINYREAYGLFIANGILFDHESPRRGETFVTRKITRAAGRIKEGLQDKLFLGNLDAKRDWGFAGDYVEAMWLMLQQDKPDTFVVATGESHTVREFAEAVFDELGLSWKKYVEVDRRYLRPTEVDSLCGDASKAKKALGWKPKVGFAELVRMMVAHDLELARQEKTLKNAGHKLRLEGRRMDERARIAVAGYQGLVGSAILRRLEAGGFRSILKLDRGEVDLTDQAATRAWFERERPEYLFLAAATLGGIVANATAPADFLRDNLLIQTHVIDAAYRAGLKKLLFLGSSCIYPKLAPQPLKEEYLLTGPLEPTNDAYALAKIAGIRMVQAYRQQYALSGISLMPTNLYGPGDNFDLKTSHVLPALIRKFHEAKTSGAREVAVWGTGRPRRELMHVDDLADAALFLMERYDDDAIVNIGTGKDVTIAELAELVREVVGFAGGITFDPAKPDGTPQKLLDVSRLTALGWRATIGLRQGIERTYAWYLANQRR